MKMLPAFFIVLLLLLPATSAFAQTLKVVEAAVTTKVSKGKPVDSVHRISHRSVKALYFLPARCWSLPEKQPSNTAGFMESG